MNDAGQLDALCVNTVRTLSMDAVQAANSGHPGTPTGASIGMQTFGASAPLKERQKKFGFTTEAAVTTTKAQLVRGQA